MFVADCSYQKTLNQTRRTPLEIHRWYTPLRLRIQQHARQLRIRRKTISLSALFVAAATNSTCESLGRIRRRRETSPRRRARSGRNACTTAPSCVQSLTALRFLLNHSPILVFSVPVWNIETLEIQHRPDQLVLFLRRFFLFGRRFLLKVCRSSSFPG